MFTQTWFVLESVGLRVEVDVVPRSEKVVGDVLAEVVADVVADVVLVVVLADELVEVLADVAGVDVLLVVGGVVEGGGGHLVMQAQHPAGTR